MDQDTKAALERAEEVVEREKEKLYSKQPRFAGDSNAFFAAVYRWVKTAEIEAPDYKADSRARDAWLRRFWPQEPHLSGVLNSVVNLDKNRGWSLTGGRNQVYRYTKILHAYERGKGWRYGLGQTALSFYTADAGGIVELGREGRGGPLRALYHVDPARCKLTPTGLEFRPPTGKLQRWTEGDDFFRCAPMPSTDETMHGLGFCAVSRALEIAKLLLGVLWHDQEQLGARAPKGLLLLRGISETQWNTAMAAREEALEGMERRYYGGVAVLASEGLDQLDARLVALSQLPAGFDQKTFTDLMMYAYALVFGYDPGEFWPVQFGSLGRGTEAEQQHRAASSKGGLDFTLAFQEQLQSDAVLPETLQFEFDSRDMAGDLQEANVAAAWTQVAATLESMLPPDLVVQYLADKGVIPPEWTEAIEDVEAEDTDSPDEAKESQEAAQQAKDAGDKPPAGKPGKATQQDEEALESERVRRAMDEFPGEDIVRYRWTPARPWGVTRCLWRPGDRHRWQVTRAVQRQEGQGAVLYADPDGDFTITEADVERAIADGRRRLGAEYGELLEGESLTAEELAAADNTEGEE